MNGTLRRVLPDGVFFTMTYARLNRGKRPTIDCKRGTHPPLILAHPEMGRPVGLPDMDGDVVGAFADASFAVKEIVVRPNDRFFLYTDGVFGARW